MTAIYNTYFYQPLLATFHFIFNNLSFHDLGLAIVLLTIFVRIVLFPLFYRGLKDQLVVKKIQPQIKEIQKKHKDDKLKQTQALMALYKENKFSPFSGFVILLVQLPVLLALFQIFSRGLEGLGVDNFIFLNLVDLRSPNMILVIIAAILQYWQMKAMVSSKKEDNSSTGDMMHSMNKTMVFVSPGITLLILANLPAALAIYWSVSTLFSIGQQQLVKKRLMA
ncbi:MAG: YidC/Oxa1 family membrane protein insertase [bacterium]|nr:YidC/Oxa1 family membrane protein insertase [bacterium]